MGNQLLPELVLKVVLSGLLNSKWGKFNRSTIVRFFIYGNNVKIGVGEGNIHQWEIDALRSCPIRREWRKVEPPVLSTIPGIKYVPGDKNFGMPRELIPIKASNVQIFVDYAAKMIFPAYRCFDINLGIHRIISIISPKTLVKDVAEAFHPSLPKRKYRRRVNNVEVSVETLSPFIKKGFGISVLRSRGGFGMGDKTETLPLLGNHDLLRILEKINETF